MIEFRTLGPMELRGHDGEEILSILAQPKRTALLAYLAVDSPRCFHRRDELIGIFWPEMEQARARAALRKSIHHLRRSLGKKVIMNRGDEDVGLDWKQVHCDVTRFEDAIGSGEPKAALDLYRGDFLKGFHLSGCPEFDQWMGKTRNRLAGAAGSAAWEVGHALLAEGKIAEAEQVGQRALDLTGPDERRVRRFMQALAKAGDRTAALKYFERFSQILRTLLDLDPSEETLALAESLRTEQTPAPEPARGMETVEIEPSRPAPSGFVSWARETWSRAGPVAFAAAALVGFVLFAGTVTLIPRGGRESGTGIEERESVGEALAQNPAIAILPFNHRSELQSDQYFTDGIQDELLNRLSRVRGLTVISRTSSDTYRDTDKSSPEIGRELGVGYLLKGSVQRAGGNVRIIVQLIDAEADSHIWGDEYDRELSPEILFDIQSEIVEMIAGELDIKLREEERLIAAQRWTTDLEAFELYLRGRELPTARAYEEKVRLLEEAIDRDPGFVVAHSELAMAHADQYQSRGERSEEMAAAAWAAADSAVKLAPESEDAQLAKGMYYYRVEGDYKAALDWINKASLRLLGDYDYHRYRGWIRRRAGQWRQAVASMEVAVRLSPRAWDGWNQLGGTYRYMRRYAESEAAFQEWQRLSPNSSIVIRELAQVAWFRDGTTDGFRPFLPRDPYGNLVWFVPMQEGRHEDALAIIPNLPDMSGGQHTRSPKSLREGATLEALGEHEAAREKYWDAVSTLDSLVQAVPDDHRYHSALARAYAGLGMREEAVQHGERAVDIMPRSRDAMMGSHPLFELAAVHARFGEVDEAVDVLEELLSAPSHFSPNMLEVHYRLRPIHDDPRFKALMDRERDKVF